MQPSELLPMEIDVMSVKSMMDSGDDFVLVDCREEDEYRVARIDAAVLLPLSALQQRAGELESYRSHRIVIHCHHGARSLQMTQVLRAGGFEQSQSMAGGIDAWSQQVDPAVPRY